MKQKKLLTLIGSLCLILALVAIPFTACTPEEVTPTPPEEEEPTPPAEKSVVQIGWSETPQAGMNPFLARNEGDYLYLGLMYEPLCMPMMSGTVEPWIAKSWEYKPEESTWIFHLDERAKWSDGEPLTADDVKFTFETAYKYDFSLGATTEAFVDSIQAIDGHTVSFKMKEPSAAFLSLAGGTLIMPKHIWSEVDQVDEYPNPNPVGSGPFLFKEFVPRQYFIAVKNQDYWRGPAYIDEVVIRCYSNMEAAIMLMKRGEIDIMPDLSGQEALIPALQEDPAVNVVVDKWPHDFYLAVNFRSYPLNLLKVRQAMNVVIDRRAVIQNALGGYGEYPPLMGYVPPALSKWADTDLVWPYTDMSEEERVTEANAMLDDLGFKAGKDGIRVTDKGKKIEFRLRVMTWPSYIRAAEQVKKDLEKIGIECNILTSDPETLYGGIIYSGERTEDWDLLVHGSTVGTVDYIARDWAPEPPTSWCNGPAFGWENEETVSLMQASRREMDETKRLAIVKKWQKLFADELVVIMLGHRLHPAAYRTDRLTDWNPARINYVGALHPLGSIQNLLSVRPINK